MDGQQQINPTITSSHPRLALIELIEPGVSERRTVDVLAWPLTLGRALDNHIVIDDPFVAAHHALMDIASDGSLQLTALDSVNGVQLDTQNSAVNHLLSGHTRALPVSGAVLKLGNTRLRLRLPHEALAPEQLLPPLSSAVSAAVPASAAFCGRGGPVWV
jgi:pSer/pThr/pTyr-binding forkhead associated (FHA) protein